MIQDFYTPTIPENIIEMKPTILFFPGFYQGNHRPYWQISELDEDNTTVSSSVLDMLMCRSCHLTLIDFKLKNVNNCSPWNSD